MFIKNCCHGNQKPAKSYSFLHIHILLKNESFNEQTLCPKESMILQTNIKPIHKIDQYWLFNLDNIVLITCVIVQKIVLVNKSNVGYMPIPISPTNWNNFGLFSCFSKE